MIDIGDVSLGGLLHWLLGYIVSPLYTGLRRAYLENPSHVVLETVCILTIVYLLLHRRFNPNERIHSKLTKQEEEELLQEWTPQALALPTTEPAHQLIVSGARINGFVRVVGSSEPKLDFTSYDIFGFSASESIKSECAKTIIQFGVGSCGPRGFYGTVTPHLLLEEKFAKFIGTEAAILYSDALAAVSSVIASFSKAGDLIVCDDGVSHDVRCGLTLSRSRIMFFKHNDMGDLERVLAGIESENAKSRNWSKHRKFIVVEGVYQNFGDICPIDEVVRLKRRYCCRLILDDSLGFGVLGGTGRGTCELKAVDIGDDVEIWCCRLDTSLASVGGICCGSKQVVEHQRLSGAGYVFSASSAMFTCTAAVQALALIEENPDRCAWVRQRARYARQVASQILGQQAQVAGHPLSPILYIRFLNRKREVESSLKLYESVADCMLNYFHMIVAVARFVPGDRNQVPPAIRVVVSACHTDQQLSSLMSNLRHSYETQMQLQQLKEAA